MKLKDWADKQGISYLTAWRWFKAGDPRLSKGYQSDTGTIIIPEDNEPMEQTMATNTNNDAMSIFLKKTVEFSKSNSTVEEFAAYVLSNFSLKLNAAESPKYSKQKPKQEEIQKHFQQFLPDGEKVEHLKAVKTCIKEVPVSSPDPNNVAELSEAISVDTVNLGGLLSVVSPTCDVHLYNPQNTAEGLVTRSVDFNTTPQQINYTGSTSQPFGSSFSSSSTVNLSNETSFLTGSLKLCSLQPTGAFQPTQKELQSSLTAEDISDNETLPRRRGRRSLKKK